MDYDNTISSTTQSSDPEVLGALISSVFWIFIILLIIGSWRLFSKAGIAGWKSLVPIYNLYILLKIVKRPGWWILLFLIPGVPFILGIVIAFDLAKAFGKSTIFAFFLLWLFPIGGIILALDNSKYIYQKDNPVAFVPQQQSQSRFLVQPKHEHISFGNVLKKFRKGELLTIFYFFLVPLFFILQILFTFHLEFFLLFSIINEFNALIAIVFFWVGINLKGGKRWIIDLGFILTFLITIFNVLSIYIKLSENRTWWYLQWIVPDNLELSLILEFFNFLLVYLGIFVLVYLRFFWKRNESIQEALVKKANSLGIENNVNSSIDNKKFSFSKTHKFYILLIVILLFFYILTTFKIVDLFLNTPASPGSENWGGIFIFPVSQFFSLIFLVPITILVIKIMKIRKLAFIPIILMLNIINFFLLWFLLTIN